MINFNIENFIKVNITNREESLFIDDLKENNQRLIKAIEDKSALVIGGAGTIGSNYIRELLKFNPKKLIVIDSSERGLQELIRNLRSSYKIRFPKDFRSYCISYDDDVFYKILSNEGRFDIVANFAAHKLVVTGEKDNFSIESLIRNNVINAYNLLEKLKIYKPNNFFCVSTDKAANPVNIMGASKKIMEEVIMSYNNEFKVSTARFANVAFSNASLLDGFISRVLYKQPISAPNDVKRYFVSPEESGQICLISSILGNSGDIFFPKLSDKKMLTFSAIANKFLYTLGYVPDLCESEDEAKEKAHKLKNSSKRYPVYYFKSDTSGEKSFEEFYTDNEIIELNKYNSLGIVKSSNNLSQSDIKIMINHLSNILNNKDVDKQLIVKELMRIIPNFKHIETGKTLEQKM